MKWAHKVTLSVFAYSGEDMEEVEKHLETLSAIDLDKEKVKVQQKTAEGFSDEPIKIFTIELMKQKHTLAFLHHLVGKLSENQRKLLLAQKESRLDEDNKFFIRISKPDLLKGKYVITDSGNCYHIKISVAAFPANREKALEVITSMLMQL